MVTGRGLHQGYGANRTPRDALLSAYGVEDPWWCWRTEGGVYLANLRDSVRSGPAPIAGEGVSEPREALSRPLRVEDGLIDAGIETAGDRQRRHDVVAQMDGPRGLRTIPINVGRVPCYSEEYVNTETALRVAAALQIQLTRDFTPLWGIPVVVSAFQSLDDVPPAAIPRLIVKPGSLEPRGHAFHITDKGQPIVLIEGNQGWSLPASHELLETVCDPQGKTRVAGESIADYIQPEDLAPEAQTHPRPQGQVAYLLEICGPCQAISYTVNGIHVSDFVTPRYYGPGGTEGGLYSLTGKITRPLQVLQAGTSPGTRRYPAHRSGRR